VASDRILILARPRWGCALKARSSVRFHSPRALCLAGHAYGDVVPTALLAFQGPTQPFSVAGVPIDRDAFVTEVGLDYTATSSTTLGIAYSGQYGQRATDNAIKAHLDYRF
jgi:uncharacterized protein with beta-barrel porin domain